MARIARIVLPGFPHHLSQRGNRGQRTFFAQDDYRTYLALLAEWCGRCGVAVWAYCLKPNHVHLIVVPKAEDGLRRAVGEAHRRYTRRVNFKHGWRGHLWQGRVASYALDTTYLLACARHLAADPDDGTVRVLHRHETTGRPAGSARFLTRVEKLLGRVVRPQRPGRKKHSP